MSSYPLDFLIALNRWQIGSECAPKAELAAELQSQVEQIPKKHRVHPFEVFRRIDLSGVTIGKLRDALELPETISSWTRNRAVAEHIYKVPKYGTAQGTIFSLVPPDGSVILSIPSLFNEFEFIEEISARRGDIPDFDKGTGRYLNCEEEIILRLERIELAQVRTWAGHTRSQDVLDRTMFQVFWAVWGRPPTPEEYAQCLESMKNDGLQEGEYWLQYEESVNRISTWLSNRRI